MPELTAQEKDDLGMLARSRGWRVLLKHYVVPTFTSSVERLAQPTATSAIRDNQAGVHLAMRQLVHMVYAGANLPNPFDDPYGAVLRAADNAGAEVSRDGALPHEPEPKELARGPVRPRTSSPVL